MSKCHLVWTRPLLHIQTRSIRKDTTILIVGKRIALIWVNVFADQFFKGAMARPMVPKKQNFPGCPCISTMVRLIPIACRRDFGKNGDVTRLFTFGIAVFWSSADSATLKIGCVLTSLES